MEAKMKLSPMLRILFVLALMLGSADYLSAQIVRRETTDPLQTGTASWIKVTFNVAGGTRTYLNDSFTGTEFRIDLNVDGDANIATNPGDLYTLRGPGDIFTSPPGVPGGNNDDTIYLPVRQGSTTPYPYDTNLRPWIWLVEGGGLQISGQGTSGPWGVIQYPSVYIECDDAIAPIIRQALYYDDGSGSSAPLTGTHAGNMMPFDGFIDRIDLIWSEPMRTSNITVNDQIFSGLGSTIHSLESIGSWNLINGQPKRFTLWVRSNAPNSGITPILTYTQPISLTDRFREAPGAQFQSYADSHARAVTDKAGPAIISAHTKRAIRRQPLAAALASKLIEVTFSEPLNFTSVQGGDFTVVTTTTSPSLNPISAIISPGPGSTASAVYEFQLSTNYATGDEVGTIQFTGPLQVTDVIPNNNGESTAATPPTLPTPGAGALVPITDGIFPIITQVMTHDAILPADLTVGGYNGWGYLDYVDVVFDHAMNTSRVSSSGFSVSGEGILTIGGTGSWVSANSLRVILTATTPKVANTGLIPRVTYANPGNPNGLNEPVNGGLVEALYSSDITVSSTNGQALQVIDMAGPAIIRALTAGTKRIRMVFSEKVNTSGWPTAATLLTSPTFKWIVGPSYFDISGTRIYFTGMTPSRRDSIVYLNHTGLAWTKNDSGAINYRAQALVYDLASSPNGNQQYDDDLSISAPTRALLGSDAKVERDNIPPILLRLETVDIDVDGKLDHYRFTFDDLSPIYPRRSFKFGSWTITGYDGLKSGVDVDMNIYNPGYSLYQPTAINAYGDTVEVYVKFNETTGLGPVLTPYGGDTGDVPDVVVLSLNGFTDWADNPMAALPVGITLEKDKAGPAIMSAKTISRFDVEAFMSEDLADGTVISSDFYLNMAPNANYFSAWPIREAKEVLPGKALINTMYYSTSLGWDPKAEGLLRFDAQGDVNDVVNPVSNGNMQTDWVTVTSNAACMFVIQPVAFGAQVRGVPFDVQVIARDKNGNIDKNFAGYLTFSSNLQANEIVMPSGPKQLVDGIGVFRFTSWVTTSNLIISASIATDVYPLDGSASSAIMVIDPVIDQPDYLTIQDVPGDQGGYVTLKWPFSANHQGMGATPVINYYEIFYTINGEDTLHYWPQQISAYNPSGTGSTMMVVDLPVVSSDSISFYVRAVWVPPAASAKGSTALAAVTEPYAGAVPLAILSLNGESAVTSVLGATGASVVSGTASGSGRAIDNIAPLPPAQLLADKKGAAIKLHWNKVTRGVNGTLERAGTIAYDIYMHETNPYFNPESAGTLLATTADTSFMVNAGGLRQYFVIRAKDTDNKSGLSRRVGKYGFDLVRSSKPRYNYISLPLDTDISNAKQLAEAIGSGVKVVLQLDHKTNGFSTYYLPELNFPTTPFAIHSGMPVLVQADLTAPESWFYCGTVPVAGALQFSLSTAFKYTYNEIILPLDRQEITDADQLAAEIGGVDVLLKLSSDGRGFSQYWLPALKFGNPMTPFSIAPGEPVLIQVNKTAPALWPTNAR
jgi:hypothetical protein